MTTTTTTSRTLTTMSCVTCPLRARAPHSEHPSAGRGPPRRPSARAAAQGGYADVGEEGQQDELGKAFYRLMVIAYFVLLPSYFWYRWLYTIEWDVPYRMYYQTTSEIAVARARAPRHRRVSDMEAPSLLSSAGTTPRPAPAC